MKAIIGSLALAFCINAAASSFESAEKAWVICAPTVRAQAQRLLEDHIRNAAIDTLEGELGSVSDIHIVNGNSNIVDSTTFYSLSWTFAAEGIHTRHSYGEFEIRAEAVGKECRIIQ